MPFGGAMSIFLSAQKKYQNLYSKVTEYLKGKDVYVRDVYACADENFRLNIRVINEYPWSNLFAYNMFLRPTEEELDNFTPDWSIINVPSFVADAEIDGTRQHNFAIINFTDKNILIGGTGYTGEIKKGIFSVLNFILPHMIKMYFQCIVQPMSVLKEILLYFLGCLEQERLPYLPIPIED